MSRESVITSQGGLRVSDPGYKSNGGRTMWCGPYALALLSGREYDSVYASCLRGMNRWRNEYAAKRGRRKPKRTKVIISLSAGWLPILGKTLGLTIEWKAAPKGTTVGNFAELHTVKDRTYLLNITGHYCVVRNGLCYDQDGPRPIGTGPGRAGGYARTRVEQFAEVKVK